jgi:hypothetical protein
MIQCEAHLPKQADDKTPTTCQKAARFAVAPVYPPSPQSAVGACDAHVAQIVINTGAITARVSVL